MLFLVQCEGTGYIHIYRFFLFGLVKLEQFGDLRQKLKTVVFSNDVNEILCLGIELVAAHFNKSGGLVCARQSRGLEHALHRVVLRHCSSQAEHG